VAASRPAVPAPAPPAATQGSGPGGLADLSVLVIEVPNFPPGTTDPVVVTAVKTTQGISTSFNFHAIDMAGNDRFCDPIDLGVIREQGKPQVVTAEHVPGAAHLLTVQNATPGITNLQIEVNGQRVGNVQLADGETRTVEIGAPSVPVRTTPWW
jgi:hypothetical protein